MADHDNNMTKIIKKANEVFDNDYEKSAKFLVNLNPDLNGRAPLAMVDEENWEDVLHLLDKMQAEKPVPAMKILTVEEIDEVIQGLIDTYPDKFAQAKEKPALRGWFLGQFMIATFGKVSPTVAVERFKKVFELA